MRGGGTAYRFVLPLAVIVLTFLIYPIVKAALMSVQYWYLPRQSASGNYFVGLKNYQDVFSDRYFQNSMARTLNYTAVTVLARFPAGPCGGAVSERKIRVAAASARALMIIPWAVPEVVACLVWVLMYDKDFGIVNYMLTNVGVMDSGLAYLMDPKDHHARGHGGQRLEGLPLRGGHAAGGAPEHPFRIV